MPENFIIFYAKVTQELGGAVCEWMSETSFVEDWGLVDILREGYLQAFPPADTARKVAKRFNHYLSTRSDRKKAADYIKQLRLKCDLSQREMAKLLNIHPGHLCRMETSATGGVITYLPAAERIFKQHCKKQIEVKVAAIDKLTAEVYQLQNHFT